MIKEISYQFYLLQVGGAAVVGLYEGPTMVEDGADHHPQREHVTEHTAH